MKTSVRLPPNVVALLYNEIRRASKTHTLKCGCQVHKGQEYHAVGARLTGRNVVHYKQHALGLCLSGPSTPIPPCVAKAMN